MSSSIFEYSDDDFPSLENGTSQLKRRHKKAVFKTPIELVQNPNKTAHFRPINLEDAIIVERPTVRERSISDLTPATKTKKPNTKNKLKTISTNPLDSDNPICHKGIANMKKKPKSLSKIKKSVFENRPRIKNVKKESLESEQCDPLNSTNDYSNESILQNVYLRYSPKVNKILEKLKPSKTTSHENVGTSEEDENNLLIVSQVLTSSLEPIHKLVLHNHNFKRYCENIITNELNSATEDLVSEIVRFQNSKYRKNPIKAVADKRFVSGIKQTKKFTKLNKVKLIIFVPDMEDAMNIFVEELKSLANAYCIPIIFASTRQKLGFLTCKKTGVCCFGLLEYSGAENNFNRVMAAATTAKKLYNEKKTYVETRYSDVLCRDQVDLSSEILELEKEFDSKCNVDVNFSGDK